VRWKKTMKLGLLALIKWVECMCVVFYGMFLSVVVVVELANLDVRQSCRTAGWMKNGEIVELEWSCSCVAVLVWVKSRWEAPYKVPYFPFNAVLFEVCSQSLTTPRQHCGKPTVYFLSVLIVEVSPIFGIGATHNFGLHPEGCSPNSLFVFVFIF